jgi:hypothetical protein
MSDDDRMSEDGRMSDDGRRDVPERTPHDGRRDLPGPAPDDDPTAARLRAALTAEAAMVQPDDSLSSIQERTGAERPWWQRPAVLATAAAVVLGLAVGGGIALLGGDDDPTVATPGGEGSTSPADATTSVPEDTASQAEGTATPTAAGEQVVWVYYVMDAGAAGPRLYREEHAATVPDGEVAAAGAVRAMLGDDPVDPDYGTLWPAGTTLQAFSVDDEVAVVDVDALPSGATASSVAVQQLVYTVTANDPAMKQVQLRVDGELPSAGGLDRPISRAPRMDVQGMIWLLGPTEGETVSSPVEITGYGTAFEATVNWEVRRVGSDEVVAEGFTDAGANGEFADFRDSVELDPGTYELRAFESSAEDGRPLNTDSKVFTVE